MENHRTNTYEYGTFSVVVHRPALDEKELQKREATLLRALAAYGKETMKRKE